MLFVASTGLGQQVPSTGSGGAPVVVGNSDSKSSLLIDEGSVAAEAETDETETAIQDATKVFCSCHRSLGNAALRLDGRIERKL